MSKRNKMAEFRMGEISGCPRPAQEPALAVIMKRANRAPAGGGGSEGTRVTLQKDMADLLTSETDGHQHGVVVSRSNGRLSVYVTYAKGPDDETSHSHAIARSADGLYMLATDAGHTHSIDQAAMAQALIALTTKGQTPMADGTQKTDDKPTVEDVQKQLAHTQAIVALSADERAHFDGLETEAQDAFLTKSADDRCAEIEAAAKAKQDEDPVVYTTAKGVALRKSAGELAIGQAREIDEQAGKLAKYEAEREQATLEKRADDELPHLPGTVEVRAAMLKQVDAIEDDDTREAAHQALKANNDAMAKAFETHGGGGEPEPGSPDEQLEKMAKAHAEEHEVSEAAAMAKVMHTPKGQALYKASVAPAGT